MSARVKLDLIVVDVDERRPRVVGFVVRDADLLQRVSPRSSLYRLFRRRLKINFNFCYLVFKEF